MLRLIRFLLVLVTGDLRIGLPEYMSIGLVASFLLDAGLRAGRIAAGNVTAIGDLRAAPGKL
ncbi:MAG TPA: hypothetical protein VHI72_11795 [Hyphomicrobiaceae bacterium]|nr:hypothetical protein [Hyphomicrobiaceae bacterium]